MLTRAHKSAGHGGPPFHGRKDLGLAAPPEGAANIHQAIVFIGFCSSWEGGRPRPPGPFHGRRTCNFSKASAEGDRPRRAGSPPSGSPSATQRPEICSSYRISPQATDKPQHHEKATLTLMGQSDAFASGVACGMLAPTVKLTRNRRDFPNKQ